MCVKYHNVHKITYIQLKKKSSQLKNFTLTLWAAWATNISCEGAAHTGPRGVAHGLRGAASLLEVPLRRPMRSLGTNFETKTFKVRWFLGPSDQNEHYNTLSLS